MQLNKHYVATAEYRIPVLELLPDDSPSPPPGVVLCPGAGGNKEQVLENMWRLSERGFATLSLDGPELGERRTKKGIPRAANEGPTAHVRWLEIQAQYARDFGAVLGWWIASDRIDAARVGAWGRSFGANCLYIALQNEQRVRAAVVVIGTPNAVETLPLRIAALPERGPEPTPELWREIRERFAPLMAMTHPERLRHVPLLACSGDKDPLMPLEVMARFVEKIEGLPPPKAAFEHRVYDSEHRATPAMERDWIAWFEQHLKQDA